MARQREQWGSKIGVILAVAGSAIGLGNFLRFPVKAAVYGGGAFLIPYFIAFLLIGIPLAWIEWTLGRYGGSYSHGSGPGILNAVTRRPWGKYVGSLGVFGPLLISFYYVYIESWLLGFSWYSLSGELMRQVAEGTVPAFFGRYIGLSLEIMPQVPAALFFFAITFVLNFLIISLGVRRGIELCNKFALPVILILGVGLLVRVLTLPGIERGMAFMWNPDYSKLLSPRVWLEASGQIFFTLSIGMGAVLTYASYVKKHQDIALSSVSAASANEFAEVILGGTIVVPLAIVIYGANIESIAKMGTFGLGLNTMPVIFGHMPLGQLLQFIWFSLLFLAGITSSISMIQPGLSFFEETMKLERRRAVGVVAGITLVMSLLAIFGLEAGAVDEMDFWGGTLLLVVFGTFEAVIFAWIFGIDRGWEELNRGAHIRLPRIYRFIMLYITPVYLIALLVAWIVTDGWNVIVLKGTDTAALVQFAGMTLSKGTFIMLVRLTMFIVWGGIIACIFFAWKNHGHDDLLERAGENDTPPKEAARG